jgi:predicted acetyltransferase
MDVTINPARHSQRQVMEQLLQLYLHDMAEFHPAHLCQHGLYKYPWLDQYFSNSPAHEAYFIATDGELAGFALIRIVEDEAWHLNDFFIIRGRRGGAVGKAAASQVLDRHPGPWSLTYLHNNQGAAHLWRSLVGEVSDGPAHWAVECSPETPYGKVRLRFRYTPVGL